MENTMTAQTLLKSRTTGAVLTTGIVALTAATAYIHLTLGGLLFLLNGLGYAGLIMLVLIAAIVPHPLVARFDWFPRVALVGYAATTIVGYLVMGPYFALGWIAKVIEVTLIGLVLLDVVRVYGSLRAMIRRAVASVVGILGSTHPAPGGAGSPIEAVPAVDAPETA
jgi:hypothetical protein